MTAAVIPFGPTQAAELVDMPSSAPIDAKTWATLQARAALTGIQLQRFVEECGRTVYVVTAVDWAQTRQLDDVHALNAFLERAEALRR